MVWTFCPSGLVVENLPPEQVVGVSKAGWNFSAKPTIPYQYSFKVTLHGLTWYLQTDGRYDLEANPTQNAAVLERFVRDHGLHTSFEFPHPHFGPMQCRFRNLPTIPKGAVSANGLIEAFEVELIHHNPAYNNVSIPMTLPA